MEIDGNVPSWCNLHQDDVCREFGFFLKYDFMHAQVAKLVDAAGLGPAAARCGGSSPFLGTTEYLSGMSLLVVTCAGLLSEKIANKITSNEKAARIINRKRKGHYGL